MHKAFTVMIIEHLKEKICYILIPIILSLPYYISHAINDDK